MSLLTTILPRSLVCASVTKPWNTQNIRSLKSALKIKWVRPVPVPHTDATFSGDKSKITDYTSGTLVKGFENIKELETADENVKKIFQIDANNKWHKYVLYKEELTQKVRRHAFDNHTHEVWIAHLTAKIRFLREYAQEKPKDVKSKIKLQHTIDKRKKLLKHLRRWDYKRFEWILDKLDLVFKPDPYIFDRVERKKSMIQLTDIHCEELKQKKIAEYRKKMDTEKIPFLEKKLAKLQWIKDQETYYELSQSVTEDDIVKCQEQLKKVKLELESSKDKNYLKSIHPYTLEIYDKDELERAEQTAIKTT